MSDKTAFNTYVMLPVVSIISVYESNDTLCDSSNIVVFVHWLMCKPHDKYRLWFQPYFK